MIRHNIREFCKKKGISMAELARMSGVPYDTMKRWGTKTKAPSALSVYKVSKALGASPEELLRGEE